MQRRTIFVTGGAGFIGSSFIRYLLKTLADVHMVVYDKLTYAGNLENLVSLWDDPRIIFIQGDICDAHAVCRAMDGCAFVVHFAAETHVDCSIVEPDRFVRTNVEGTFTLLESARRLGIERFIHISTSEVYGNAEALDGTMRPSLETDALKPLSPYAASKASADCLAFSYWATYGVPVVITRGSNCYGPYQYPEKQLPLFITNALAGCPFPVYGDGHSIRDWIHVDDYCAALKTILTAHASLVLGEVFNIGTGEERSILENAHALLDLLELPESLISFVPDRPGHVRVRAVDSRKLRKRLGWSPQVSFHEGLRWTVDWYRDHSAWLERSQARRKDFLKHTFIPPTSTVEAKREQEGVKSVV